MKYDKAKIVEMLEKQLEKFEESEERTYQYELKHYEKDQSQQALARRKVREFREWLENASLEDVEDFQELDRRLGGRFEQGSVYQALQVASKEGLKPVKRTEQSEQFRGVLEVFKTGAPPQVGVTDLRGFGLMQFVKYGG